MYVSPADGGTRVDRQAPRCQPTAFIENFFRNYSITLPDIFFVAICQRTNEPYAEPSLLELCWGERT